MNNIDLLAAVKIPGLDVKIDSRIQMKKQTNNEMMEFMLPSALTPEIIVVMQAFAIGVGFKVGAFLLNKILDALYDAGIKRIKNMKLYGKIFSNDENLPNEEFIKYISSVIQTDIARAHKGL